MPVLTHAPSPQSGAAGITRGVVQNPAFDRRMLPNGAVDRDGRFIPPTRSQLYRGRIETAKRWNGHIYRVQFLFNPQGFTHSGAIDNDLSPQTYNLKHDLSGSDLLQLSQGVSFSLLFDRTYETWQQDKYTDTAKWGVLADIKYLYALLGMYDGINQTNGQWDIDQGKALLPEYVDQLTPTAPMQWRPVWVVFGPRTKFFGVIQSFNVTYQHFTQQMTPNRCEVNISMQLIPKTDTNNQISHGPGAESDSPNLSPQQKRIIKEMNGLF